MMQTKIGYDEALNLTLDHIGETGHESAGVLDLAGRILAEEVTAGVDSPMNDVSKKDGFAVFSQDVRGASPDRPVALPCDGFTGAGDARGLRLQPGRTMKIMTGARLPAGAEAVLASEFCEEQIGLVKCFSEAEPGRNILPQGTDVSKGEVVAHRGDLVTPALMGFLAAAGCDQVKVFRRVRVAVIATGNEITLPGRPLSPGAVYASNLVETTGWLQRFGMIPVLAQAPDDFEALTRTILDLAPQVDALVTSGGAWTSERDLMLTVLQGLGWQGIYHRVRMGPGKAVGFGLYQGRPFFILPGGPPSHELAWLKLALPGLLAFSGYHGPAFPVVKARLTETVRGQRDWTQFIHAQVNATSTHLEVTPFNPTSRLKSMARKDTVITIPEGREEIPAGTFVDVELLRS
ncbi:MAG: molybdopterin molybdotransferase MoeA [Deltaproteobacteria bacterium]|nr:molybdopterin molybdotransferase MoeA [Deltaproteobacteria bacterium]